MADNVAITPGVGTEVAADDIAGVKHQRVKIQIGDDGSATDVSATNQLPVMTRVQIAGAMKTTAVSVTTSATLLPASALANRRTILIANNGAAAIYIGGSDVTTANGFPLQPNQAIEMEIGTLAIYGRVAAGTVEARVLEVA